jgi:serine/threonine protein phosphatase PrpC
VSEETADRHGEAEGGRDHVESVLDDPGEPAPAAAGVSDRGHHRRRNEDSFALGRCRTADGRPAVMAVVADGVASVPGGDVASSTAGTAAIAAGSEALAEGEEPAYAATVAVEAAKLAVSALAPDEGRPPACTYVSALVVDETAIVSWLGDSRAYWLAPGDPQLLTEDDSWATEMIAAGLADPETVHLDTRAHVITRWLAADAPDVSARSIQVDLDDSGVLLLCSDGVWNHLPDPQVLQDVLARTGAGLDAMHGARALVQAALDDGGTDNATAVLVTVAPERGGH